MKFLITGGLGFIGSNFILYVLEKYPTVKIINVDAKLEGSNKKNLSSLKHHKNYQFINANITNQGVMEKLVTKVDAVFNFAAESHVDRSISNSKPFLDSNIIGVHTILEAIKKHRKRVIQISTDEVFGSLKCGSATEKHVYNPSNPYAATKASAEMLVNSYATTFDCDVIITRCTNNYGPRQALEKLIPKTIALAERNGKIPIYGTGKNIRDWIFVMDHCDAILRVFFKGKKGESYNISATNEIDNLTIVKKILKIMKRSSDLIYLTSDRPGHDFRYSLDSTKIRRELNWKPSYDFEEGIRNTINWYLENRSWWNNTVTKELGPYKWKIRN